MSLQVLLTLSESSKTQIKMFNVTDKKMTFNEKPFQKFEYKAFMVNVEPENTDLCTNKT